jgi:hypothetical protein
MKSTGAISLLLLATVAAGCAGVAPKSVEGTGGSGANCSTISCVPGAINLFPLAVEITPPVGSGAALTEILTAEGSNGGQYTLLADTPSPVTATFVAAQGGAVPGNANIVLDVHSQIPGRPDLTFQSTASTGTDPVSGRPMISTQLAVPSGRLQTGAAATLSLLPLSPDDQQTPPYYASVTLNTTGPPPVSLPSDNISLSGTLVDSVNNPLKTTFVARAFQGSTLVSSAPLITMSNGGTFKLAIPSAVAQAGGAVTIQLTPQSQTDPWFIFASFQLPTPPVGPLSIGKVMLSAYTPVNQFNVLVEGTDSSRVSGATVTAQTTLGTSLSDNLTNKGSTSFARSGVTDSNGTAVLPLLPGTTDVPVNYTIAAVPPLGSPWATTCSDPKNPVQAIGNGNVTTAGGQPLATLKLSPRPVLTGHVTNGYGWPVAGVTITATPGSNPTGNCTSTLAAPGTTTTDVNGAFMLPLDPGSYQLDYDPPTGSSAPRYTETGVNVAGTGTIQHDRMLQLGGLVSGTVSLNTTHDLVPSATIKLFQPCSSSPGATCSTPPFLLGQGVSDTNGHFQIVVPVNP